MEAAVSYLESAKESRPNVSEEIFDDIVGHYRHRLASLRPAEADAEHVSQHFSYLELSRESARVERETAVRLRNEGRINDQVLRRIERELDLTESRFADAGED
jgi:monovalent cation/hydrogen antiporter